jgi:hypothetical protein
MKTMTSPTRTLLTIALVFSAGCSKQPLNILPAARAQPPLQLRPDFSKATPLRKTAYGVNNEFIHVPYTPNFKNYKEAYVELGKPTFRYPAGTGANYLDLATGFATGWKGMDARAKARMDGFNTGIARSGKGRNGVDLRDFMQFMREEKPVCNFVLNISSVSVDDNRKMLARIRDGGVELSHFELGNELYYTAYETAFPGVAAYIARAKKTAAVIRDIFPKAKIAVAMPTHYFTDEVFLEGPPEKATRLERWYRGLQKEDFYDAVAVHMYADLGMTPQTPKARLLPFVTAYDRAISHADSRTGPSFARLKADFPDKEVWLTEYHVGGFSGALRQYRLRYTYLGGLYGADFLFKILSNPQVTISNWHSMVQLLSYERPAKANLLDENAPFKLKVNYYFLKAFQEPVLNSTQFIPVQLSNVARYQATGGFKGTYDEVDAGIFYNDETRAGYLMLLNKKSRSYSLSVKEMEQALGGTVQGGTELSPDATLKLEEALASEEAKSIRSISPRQGMFEIKPYSVYVFNFIKSPSE